MQKRPLNHTPGKNRSQRAPLRVIDLFAGVGGFHIGLAGTTQKPSKDYEVVWANQWEPGTKAQPAAEIYRARFGDYPNLNVDIAQVAAKDIPNHDLLVGGFPCQDYSVARTRSQAAGLHGKKGVLWWEIHRILKEKGTKKPKYLMLENVDRLIKSPASQRGRDFAVMLASLSDLGYIVEWRIINAADYGMPQRRRRIYILGYHKDSEIGKKLGKMEPTQWIFKKGIMIQAFPAKRVDPISIKEVELEGDLAAITETFNKSKPTVPPFGNSGFMENRKVLTWDSKADYQGPFTALGEILQPDNEITEEFYLDEAVMPKWKYLKGAKKEPRGLKNGFPYFYTEGPMAFPDPLDKPSRTIVTGEGGATPSRFKHVVKTKKGYRRLTPIELERLNMFPDNHTEGPTNVKRAFFMGNALVVGVVEKLGKELAKQHKKASTKANS